MKRLFAVLAFATVAFLASSNASAAIDKNDWKFEPTLGPVIGIHNWGGTQFAMNFKIGKGDFFNYLMGMSFAGANAVQLKLGVAIDLPYYFTFSKNKDFSVGPTFDAGPRFGFGGGVGTSIDFMNIGFGCRTTYQFTDSFGVVADLVHFTMSFATWVKGAGVNTGFAMAYDMQFGVFLLF
jgi:hypothetical protein